MSALELQAVSVDLGRRPVLRAVSCRARAGAVTALIGPNGAGKSTLLRAVLGLVGARGAITLDGIDLVAASARERARLVAYVPQRSLLDAALSVAEVVAHGRYAWRGAFAAATAADLAAVDAALAAVDARGLSTRAFDTLSCGEQQRVLLARALATGARAIVLDEPTAALDIGHALALQALLRRLADEGRIVLVVLHQLEEVRALADHVVLLVAGAVLAAGDAASVLAAGPLRAAYGVEPRAGAAHAYERVGERAGGRGDAASGSAADQAGERR